MSLIVQKFGGTSVADCEKIKAAARKAILARQHGHHVVMVVSAMGKNTDALVELAEQLSEHPPAREMDMLLSTGEQVSVALMAMAIDAMGHGAVSLTGGQIGIRTDSSHTKARIQSISTERMRRHLESGKIVIAAGFQGIDEDLNITTLGRGGSDTTAVALAAVLQADSCEIYTDVDGIYTTDPRVVPAARRLHQISYDEMLELSSLGAGVMHNRSIEFAKKYQVPVHVRSSFTDTPGTMIVSQPESADAPVSGAAFTRNEARISISGLPDVPGTSMQIFSHIASKNIAVDMIVQNVGSEGKASLSFTVQAHELQTTLQVIDQLRNELGDFAVDYSADVAKVSVVGRGMADQVGVAESMFRALADAEINLHMITTSEIKISVLVDHQHAVSALRNVHEAFGLDQLPLDATAPLDPVSENDRAGFSMSAEQRAIDVVERLRGSNMEQLLIDDIVLDSSQGSVTIHGVPDRPGVAARVFHRIAEANIFVDMIVQGYGLQGLASLSFTVPQNQVDKATKVAESLASEFAWDRVTSRPSVSKLSVSGIGLRSHTEVALKMFGALARANINVSMINTSEVRVNVVVATDRGADGLHVLETAFESERR